MSVLAGYFKDNYGPLKGSNWILSLPKYEIQAFSLIGRSAGNHGRNGGFARARTAKRHSNGRFAKDVSNG